MECTHCHKELISAQDVSTATSTCSTCGAPVLHKQPKTDSFEGVIFTIVDQYGLNLLLDKAKAMAYFIDLAPTLKKERQMFQYLLQCGGNIQLIESISLSSEEQQACRNKVVARMIDDFFISDDMASQICDDFLTAIGVNIEPSDPFIAEFERAEGLNQFESSENDKKEAFTIYENLANQGYTPAQVELSICYRLGRGCDENSVLADQWLDKAIQAGDISAMYEKGDTLESEYKYGTKDTAILYNALDWYTKAAEAGYQYAQYILGNIYSIGKRNDFGADFQTILDLPKWDLAFSWYDKAAEGSSGGSLYRLGECYEYGWGTSRNLQKAFDCYLRSAGDPEDLTGKSCASESPAKVALFYELGIGIPQSKERANIWHPKAHAIAQIVEDDPDLWPFLQYYLGFCYQNGIYVKRDLERAWKHMRAGNNKGVIEASAWIQEYETHNQKLNEAITIIEKEKHGDVQAQAMSCIIELAKADFLPAQTCLGVCYKTGSGCEKDLQKSFEWYSKAAENGSSKALFFLSIFYKNGDYVSQDFAQELHLLRSSAEKGYVSAQTRLGGLLLWGNRGARKNEKEAVKWLERAANHGDSLALWLLGDCKRYGWGTSVDLPSAVQLYQRAADQGDANGMYELGRCYLEGIGINNDVPAAVKWFTKAAEAGAEKAMYTLGKWYAEGVNLEVDMDKARMYMTNASEKGIAEATQWLNEHQPKEVKSKWAFWKNRKQ